ncbi:hypothetical protein E1289_16640 [Actinomadura sp. 6K520]|nr:hypothetical protein E1289_16640 [Actinomadura sp. 6K520]
MALAGRSRRHLTQPATAFRTCRAAQVQFGGEHGYLDLDRVAAFVTGHRSLRSLPRAVRSSSPL